DGTIFRREHLLHIRSSESFGGRPIISYRHFIERAVVEPKNNFTHRFGLPYSRGVRRPPSHFLNQRRLQMGHLYIGHFLPRALQDGRQACSKREASIFGKILRVDRGNDKEQRNQTKSQFLRRFHFIPPRES